MRDRIRGPRPRPYYEQARWEIGIILTGAALMVVGPFFFAPFSEPYVGQGTWFFLGLGTFAGGWAVWGMVSVFVRGTIKILTGTHMNEAAWWNPVPVPTSFYHMDRESLQRELPESEWAEVDEAVALEQRQSKWPGGEGGLSFWVAVVGGIDAWTLHMSDVNKQGFIIGIGDPSQYFFRMGRGYVCVFDTETLDHSKVDPRVLRWIEWKWPKLFKRDETQIEMVTKPNDAYLDFLSRSFASQSHVAKKWGVPGIAKMAAVYFENTLLTSENPAAAVFREEWKKGGKSATQAVERALAGYFARKAPQLQIATGHNEQRMESWRARALGLQSANTHLSASEALLRGMNYDRDRKDREVARRGARSVGAAPSRGPWGDEADRLPLSQEA